MLAFDLVVALLPVLLFLGGLVFMDSFKLVRPRTVFLALVWGAVAAAASFAIHEWGFGDVTADTLKRVVAPITEESAKGVFVVWMLARRRLGFAVDAAIAGFAVGAGFAVIENLQYLQALDHGRVWLWVVRGFGTAVLHGATTCVFAMLARGMWERHRDRRARGIALAWIAAVSIHAAYNNLLLPPVLATLMLLLLLPLLIVLVYQRSEAATREWVTTGLDLDLELLQLVSSDAFVHTRFGTYLREIRERLRGPIAADMFCLLRVELELAV
ncbi:MAG TPA: PrsW family glutamic-type intramembrane protease, partial [Vicinamibacterales bacterium]|nr:PrsW family glutamic-type intramembrane protease [Vicinamibacterales bacterium]